MKPPLALVALVIAACGSTTEPPTALLLQNGPLDNLVPVADAQALHAAAPEPRTVLWYEAGHGLDQQAVVDRLHWLHEEIGLDARP